MTMRWYVELYPLYPAPIKFVQANGHVGRLRATYPTRKAAKEAEKRFYRGPHSGLLMDHQVFIDKFNQRSAS